MSLCAKAIKSHLDDLEAGTVPARERPTALQHGMLRTAVQDIEYWQAMAERAFVGAWALACLDQNRGDLSPNEIRERFQEWLTDVMQNFS